MMMRIILLVLLVVLGWSSGAGAVPIQWTVAEGGNDHWYEFVDSGQSIAWTEAKVAAEQRGGYLADCARRVCAREYSRHSSAPTTARRGTTVS